MSLNLDDVEVNIECPKCSFSNRVRLRQVRLGETIVCSGCHENIKLIDKDASADRAVRRIEKSFENLERIIGRINRR